MAALITTIDSEFTPAAGDFLVQITGAPATLLRKNAAGAAFAPVEGATAGCFVCSNPVAGAVYKFQTPFPGTAVVRADQ